MLNKFDCKKISFGRFLKVLSLCLLSAFLCVHLPGPSFGKNKGSAQGQNEKGGTDKGESGGGDEEEGDENGTPEIDPGSMTSALTVAALGVLMLNGRRRRQPEPVPGC